MAQKAGTWLFLGRKGHVGIRSASYSIGKRSGFNMFGCDGQPQPRAFREGSETTLSAEGFYQRTMTFCRT